MQSSRMDDVSLDIETLGTKPGSIIISVGAVFFNRQGLGETFYTVISQLNSKALGMTTDKATVNWWSEQSDEAKRVVKESQDRQAPGVKDVCKRFNDFIGKRGVRVWGFGANFDNVLVRVMFDKAQVDPVWSFRDDMCMRTLTKLLPYVLPPDDLGVKHNALDDAVYQAKHLVKLLSEFPQENDDGQ